jgi:hypothetical protein
MLLKHNLVMIRDMRKEDKDTDSSSNNHKLCMRQRGTGKPIRKKYVVVDVM